MVSLDSTLAERAALAGCQLAWDLPRVSISCHVGNYWVADFCGLDFTRLCRLHLCRDQRCQYGLALSPLSREAFQLFLQGTLRTFRVTILVLLKEMLSEKILSVNEYRIETTNSPPPRFLKIWAMKEGTGTHGSLACGNLSCSIFILPPYSHHG